MKTVFIYQAELLCTDCGNRTVERLEQANVFDHGDSDGFPQEEIVCESDTPDHCAGCGVFLENPLTPDGVAYVREALRAGTGDSETLATWRAFYQVD